LLYIQHLNNKHKGKKDLEKAFELGDCDAFIDLQKYFGVHQRN